MARKMTIGCPEISGKPAAELVSTEFAKVKYPLKVTVTNLMPRNLALPEITGLFLGSRLGDEHTKTVEIPSEDAFYRLASSIEQIAQLNMYEAAVTIEEAQAATAPPKTAAATQPGA